MQQDVASVVVTRTRNLDEGQPEAGQLDLVPAPHETVHYVAVEPYLLRSVPFSPRVLRSEL